MSLGVDVVNRGLCRKMSDSRISPKQREFVSLLVAGDSAREAARAVGYADHKALVANPQVRLAMIEALQAQLTSDILPLCINVLRQALTSDDLSLDKRATIAKDLAIKTLVSGAEKAKENNGLTKPLHELTRDELRSQIEKLQSEVAERAKPAVIDAQAFDN